MSHYERLINRRFIIHLASMTPHSSCSVVGDVFMAVISSSVFAHVQKLPSSNKLKLLIIQLCCQNSIEICTDISCSFNTLLFCPFCFIPCKVFSTNLTYCFMIWCWIVHE